MPKLSTDDGRRDVLRITIPLVPPSVNHYTARNRPGSRKRYRLTPEAIAFKCAVSIFVGYQWVQAKKFRVDYVVYLGKGQRGDKDNFSKLILDGLAAARVFRDPKGKPLSDAHVTEGDQRKDRDWTNPRTEIVIRPAEGQG